MEGDYCIPVKVLDDYYKDKLARAKNSYIYIVFNIIMSSMINYRALMTLEINQEIESSLKYSIDKP